MSAPFLNHPRRWLAIAVAAGLLAIPWWLPNWVGKPQLRFGFSVWPGVEVAVTARGAGELSGEKMRLMEAQWSSAVTRAFDNEMIDVAALGLDGVLRLRDRGERLRVVRVLDLSSEADAIIAWPEVTSLTALKGKRIAVDMAGTGGALLAACLKAEGIKMRELNTVQMVQAEMVDALRAGSVDAVAVSEPWLTLLCAEGYRVVSNPARAGIQIARVLVARESATREHHSGLAALVSLWDGPMPAPGQPDWESVLRREGLSAEQYLDCLKKLEIVERKANREWLGGESPKLEALAQRWEVLLRESGIISERALSKDPWLDNQFVKEEVVP